MRRHRSQCASSRPRRAGQTTDYFAGVIDMPNDGQPIETSDPEVQPEAELETEPQEEPTDETD